MPEKRKRSSLLALEGRHSPLHSDDALESENDLREKFKRHFEQSFKPLEPSHVRKEQHQDLAQRSTDVQDYEEDQRSEESPWSGVSSGEEDQPVEIIEHHVQLPTSPTSTSGGRLFMTSRPPKPSKEGTPSSKGAKSANTQEDKEDEHQNIANDLALQRLLNESNLLSKSNEHSGRGHKRRVVDSRMQALGSKSSILEQANMPMAHRKGMAAKAKEKEERRRVAAKESGIILERPVKARKGERPARTSGLKTSVGTFKNGTLTLSASDVSRVNSGRRGGKTGNLTKRIW